MAKEDLLLGVEMGKLEIEPIKTHKNINEENPFVHPSKSLSSIQIPQYRSSRNSSKYHKCSCNSRKVIAICKKKQNKIIKDPVLKILQSCTANNFNKEMTLSPSNVSSQSEDSDLFNLCALVDDCNQLRISSGTKQNNLIDTETSSRKKWWKSDSSHIQHVKKSVVETSNTGSCSQQALNPPCDVTIDELASYFETLVHIPKKMSSMAEMMYI